MKSLSLTLAAMAFAFSFGATNTEAKPPSQVPSGYQAHLDQKEKSAGKACCNAANAKVRKVAAGDAENTPKPFHKQKRGGGGYAVIR